jgi:hypothetical protein
VLGIAPLEPVTWSLSYEAAFYLAVPLLALAWGRRAPGTRAGNAAWILAASFVAIVALAAALPFKGAMYLAYFALFIPGLWLGTMDAESRVRAARGSRSGWCGRVDRLHPRVQARGVQQRRSRVLRRLGRGVRPAGPEDMRRRFASGTPPRFAAGAGARAHLVLVLPRALRRAARARSRDLQRRPHASRGLRRGALRGGFALSLATAWALFHLAESFYFERRS